MWWVRLPSSAFRGMPAGRPFTFTRRPTDRPSLQLLQPRQQRRFPPLLPLYKDGTRGRPPKKKVFALGSQIGAPFPTTPWGKEPPTFFYDFLAVTTQ